MRIIEERRRAIIDEMEAGCGSAQVFSRPVFLEPPFRPFGRKTEEYEPASLSEEAASDGGLHFIHVKPSKEDKNTLELAERFILSLPGWGPVAFEIIGHGGKIILQLAVNYRMINPAISQAISHFPYADIYEDEDVISRIMAPEAIASAYRLKSSHFFPLILNADGDPYRTLFGCLGNLSKGSIGALQVLFTPVTNNWRENIWRAAHDPHDPSRSPFIDLPLPKFAEKKLSRQLFAVSLRMVASGEASLRAMEMFLKQFESTDNGISPIYNYPIESILARNTFVHGAIMNSTELSYFLHLPTPEVLDSVIGIERAAKSYIVPEEYTRNGPVIGYNLHRGIKRVVCHPRDLPNQHCYITGESGQGKSNLILSIAIQRINCGHGLAAFDPHGKLIKDILRRIPKERLNDVIYFNAADFNFPMALNVLAHGGTKLEKEHIRVDLLDFFEDLFEATLGVNILHTLNFAIISLLTRQNSTLQDIERLLIDKSWRSRFLENIEDDRIRMFWEQEYPLLEKRGINSAILNKLSPLTIPDSTISPMLAQRENKLDFLEIMNEKKIFLANLSHGQIGKRNSQLLGKLLVSRLQIAAMMREGMENYPDFFAFIDEFQALTAPSMSEILSGARKYRLHLCLANQMTGDIPDRIMRHVFNAATLIAFSTDNPHDQKLMESTFSKKFTAEDMGKLRKGEALVKMGGSVFNIKTELVPEPPAINYMDEIIASSRTKYTGTISAPSSEKKLGLKAPDTPQLKSENSEVMEIRRRIVPSHNSLPFQEKVFLESVFNKPALSVTGIYKDQGLSAYMGDKLKTGLKEKGLLQEISTHLGPGSRVAKFLLLTPKGFKTLDMGFGPGAGKGGTLHRYWQSVIKFHAEGNGYRATIEEQISDGREAADVGLERNGERLAVEISVTTDLNDEIGNVRKCLQARYDRVIILFLDENKAGEFQNTIGKILANEEISRVSVGLVYDFYRFL